MKIFVFRLSLRIEPGSSSPRLVSSKEDLAGIVATPHRVGAKLLMAQTWLPASALTVEPKGTVQFAGWPTELSLLPALSHQPSKAPDHTGPWGIPLGRDSREEPGAQKPQERQDQNPESGACRVDRENPRVFSSGPRPRPG